MTSEEVNSYFHDNTVLKDKVFDSTIVFHPSFEVQYPYVKFENCVFNGFQYVNHGSPNLNMLFKNCIFNSSIENILDSLTADKIWFDECDIENLEMTGCEIRYLTFTCKRINQLSMVNNQGDFWKISTSYESGDFNLDLPEVKKLDIDAAQRLNTLRLNSSPDCRVSGRFKAILLGVSNCKSLVFANKQGRDEPDYSEVENLSFRNRIFNGKIHIRDFTIGTLQFENIAGPDASLSIHETRIEFFHFPDCNFREVILGQTELIEPPFLQRSNLKGLVLNDIEWVNNKKVKDTKLELSIPAFYRLRGISESSNSFLSKDQIRDLKYEKDTYRQLKLASKQNENIYDYLLFGMYEKRLHWKLVRIEGGEKWYDIILLFVDRHVSNFGYTWWVPLLWLLGFHYLLYFVSIDFNLSLESDHITAGFNQSLPLINPVHSIPDFMHGGYEWVSFVMRICSAFFIYHFLRASRKFARY